MSKTEFSDGLRGVGKISGIVCCMPKKLFHRQLKSIPYISYLNEASYLINYTYPDTGVHMRTQTFSKQVSCKCVSAQVCKCPGKYNYRRAGRIQKGEKNGIKQ